MAEFAFNKYEDFESHIDNIINQYSYQLEEIKQNRKEIIIKGKGGLHEAMHENTDYNMYLESTESPDSERINKDNPIHNSQRIQKSIVAEEAAKFNKVVREEEVKRNQSDKDYLENQGNELRAKILKLSSSDLDETLKPQDIKNKVNNNSLKNTSNISTVIKPIILTNNTSFNNVMLRDAISDQEQISFRVLNNESSNNRKKCMVDIQNKPQSNHNKELKEILSLSSTITSPKENYEEVIIEKTNLQSFKNKLEKENLVFRRKNEDLEGEIVDLKRDLKEIKKKSKEENNNLQSLKEKNVELESINDVLKEKFKEMKSMFENSEKTNLSLKKALEELNEINRRLKESNDDKDKAIKDIELKYFCLEKCVGESKKNVSEAEKINSVFFSFLEKYSEVIRFPSIIKDISTTEHCVEKLDCFLDNLLKDFFDIKHALKKKEKDLEKEKDKEKERTRELELLKNELTMLRNERKEQEVESHFGQSLYSLAKSNLKVDCATNTDLFEPKNEVILLKPSEPTPKLSISQFIPDQDSVNKRLNEKVNDLKSENSMLKGQLQNLLNRKKDNVAHLNSLATPKLPVSSKKADPLGVSKNLKKVNTQNESDHQRKKSTGRVNGSGKSQERVDYKEYSNQSSNIAKLIRNESPIKKKSSMENLHDEPKEQKPYFSSQSLPKNMQQTSISLQQYDKAQKPVNENEIRQLETLKHKIKELEGKIYEMNDLPITQVQVDTKGLNEKKASKKQK